MKTNKKKDVSKKFNLEKMKVAKLDNLHLINGGANINGDVATVTQSGKVEIQTTGSF